MIKTRWKSDCEFVIVLQHMHRRWSPGVIINRAVVTSLAFHVVETRMDSRVYLGGVT